MRTFDKIISNEHLANKTRGLLIVVVIGVTSACTAAPWHISEPFVTGDEGGYLTDAKSRVIISQDPSAASRPGAIYPRRITCVEPHPDVASTVANSFGVGISILDKGSGSISSEQAQGLAQIAQRTVSIQALQRLMFRACEAYANGGITGTGYSLLLSEINKTMVTLILAETAGGRFGQSGAAIGGKSSTTTSKVSELEGKLKELQTSQDAVDEATAKVQGSTEKAATTASTANVDGKVTAPEDKAVADANQQVKEDSEELADATERMQRTANAVTEASAEISKVEGLGQLDLKPNAEVADILATMQDNFLSTGNTQNYISACLIELGMGSNPIASLPDILPVQEAKLKGLYVNLKNLKDKETELEEQKANIEQKQEAAKQNRERLTQKLQSIEENIQATETTVAHLNSKKTNLETQETDLKQELTTAKQGRARLTKDLQSVKEAIQATKTTVTQLSSKKTNLEIQKADLKQELTTAKQDHERLTKELQSVKETIQATETTVIQLSGKKANLEIQKTDLEQELTTAKQDHERLTKELQAVKEAIQATKDTVTQLSGKRANLEIQKTDLEQELTTAKQDHERLTKELQAVKEAIQATKDAEKQTEQQIVDSFQYFSTSNLVKVQTAAKDALVKDLGNAEKVSSFDKLKGLVYKIYHLNRKTGLFAHCNKNLATYLNKTEDLKQKDIENNAILKKKMVDAAIEVAGAAQNSDAAMFAFCHLQPDAQVRRECVENLAKLSTPSKKKPAYTPGDLPNTVSGAQQRVNSLEALLQELTVQLNKLKSFKDDKIKAPSHAKPEGLLGEIKKQFDKLIAAQAKLKKSLASTMARGDSTHSNISTGRSEIRDKLNSLLTSYNKNVSKRNRADAEEKKVIDAHIRADIATAKALKIESKMWVTELRNLIKDVTSLVAQIEQHNDTVAKFKTPS